MLGWRALSHLRRVGPVLLGVVAIALVWPSAALAHVANVEYRFPLPVWLYAVAGGIVVLASAPAAAIAVRRNRGDWVGRADLYRPLAHLRLGAIGTAVATALFFVAILGGFFGDPVSFALNPAPLLIWVDFWVGLGIVSALVANVWDFISPISAAGRDIERLLARAGVGARRYPDWLGAWPAVGLLLVWTWAELISTSADRGRSVAIAALIYFAAQLVGMALFGAEVWLARAELFTVLARTFSRVAPLELYVRKPVGSCRADRCPDEGERIGCPACWIDAPRESRGLRLRPYGAGVRREPPLGVGGGAFVVTMLATVVYDGFRGTATFQRFYHYLVDRLDPSLSDESQAVSTLTMLLVVWAFALAFLLVCALVSRLEEGGLAEIASRYAPTLIPIAAAYFIAHYFLYLFYLGQLTPKVVLDPFERGWIGDYRPWTDVPGAVVWYIQVGLIVLGHIIAVVEAHRVSLQVHGRPLRTLATQVPLVLLMVGYTYAGLWVLGQALAGLG